MPWLANLTYSACFTIFVVCVLSFLLWGDRMQRRSPLAFRRVKLFGFTCPACEAAELPRNNLDLDEVLGGGYLPELVARDLSRSLREDTLLILIYVSMLVAAAAMAAQAFAKPALAFAILALLAVTAGIADLMENRGIAQALKAPPCDGRDYAAPIRRCALVKWTLLAALGFTLCALLLYSGGLSGKRVLMASIAAFLLFPFGAYCLGLLSKWWKAPGAHW